MSNNRDENEHEDDTFDEKQEPQIPRRGRTPSIIVQSLNLNAQGGTSITESIELNGDEDYSPSDENSSSNSPLRRQDTNNSSNYDIRSSNNIDNISQQLQNYTTSDTTPPDGTSNQGSSTSLYNPANTAFSPIRNMRSPAEPRAPGNRRLSLNIGTTAPRRLSLNVDSLPSFATAASLQQHAKTTSTDNKDTTADSSQSPINSSGNATGSLRNKVALKPGHSLMGWIAYTSTAKNLSGTNGKIIDVTPEELAKHDTKDDCWVALKDNVYNVTSYLQYHPGGIDELMRAAGQDATDLFNEVHMWVNFESILAKCLVGPYKSTPI